MKKNFKQTFNIIIYIAFIISHITVNRNNILNNNTKILKEMSESTQIADLNKTIEQLNSSHTEYANYIQTSKQKIANAINMYPNNNATENNTLEDLSSMITNLTNIPENTYFYQSGTEGNESTIIRYKKVGEQYYVCNEHGTIAPDTIATDVSALTLIPYSATFSNNLSANSASYSNGNLYLGNGSDNSAYGAQGFFDLNNIIHNGVTSENNIITLSGKKVSVSASRSQSSSNSLNYTSNSFKIYENGKILSKIVFTVTAYCYSGRPDSNIDVSSSNITYTATLTGNGTTLSTKSYSVRLDEYNSEEGERYASRSSGETITIMPLNYNLKYNNEIVIKASGSCYAACDDSDKAKGTEAYTSISDIQLYYVEL